MSRIVDRIVDPFGQQVSAARPVRRVSLILLMLAAFTLVGTPAWAYWTAFGTGSGSATTGTLSAPTNPVATYTAGTTSVGLTWIAPSTGTAPQGYYLTRIKNGDASRAPACATAPGSLTTELSCTDLTVPDGTFHYTVTAIYHSWTATSGSSNNVTVASDVTPPAVTINQAAGKVDPTNGGTGAFTATFSEPVTGFTHTDVTVGGSAAGTKAVAITGTGPVYTVTVSGVAGNGTIIVSIGANTVHDLAGNGNTASTSTDNAVSLDATPPTVTLTSTPTSPNGSDTWFTSAVTWTATGSDLNGVSSCQAALAYSTPDSATASVTRTCTDTAGNVGMGTATFKYDGTTPSGSVTSPAGAATVVGTAVSVASTDAVDATSGVISVQFQVKPSGSGSFANIGPAATTSPYASSWDTTSVVNGSYLLRAVVSDAAGNTFTSDSTNVTVGNVGSSVTGG